MSREGNGAAPTTQVTPMAVHQTTLVQVSNPKSVGGAVALGFLFGPLGMLYATVPGAIAMFVITLIVVIPTLGLGLILTVPACAIWAGVAANGHNKRLGAIAVETVSGAAGAAGAAPADWYEDPMGSGRLRYFDGANWTDHYADRPVAQPAELPAAGADPVAAAEEEPAPEATTEVAGEGTRFFELEKDLGEAPTEPSSPACVSCGEKIGAADRFCPACGHERVAS